MIIMCGGSFLTGRKALVRKRKGLASEYERLVLLWLAQQQLMDDWRRETDILKGYFDFIIIYFKNVNFKEEI